MYINQSQQKYDINLWLKRLGWLGFIFFLLKGVVWLTLPLFFLFAGSGG